MAGLAILGGDFAVANFERANVSVGDAPARNSVEGLESEGLHKQIKLLTQRLENKRELGD
jgi:hypothetical protein